MSSLELAGTAFAILLFLIAIRVPIGLSLMVVSISGIAYLRGWSVAASLLTDEPYDFAAHWSFSAIPMFLLMGAVAHYSGISASLFRVSRAWLNWLPGGLAVSANFACAGFAAASGSSIATAAAMGRITIPEMLKAGYHPSLATGVVASAGTLGSLIPPSIAFVLYGIFAETSISKLFIAGLLPGLLTAAAYATMIILRCRFNPAIAPKIDYRATWSERWRGVGEIWPLMVLIIAILGGLYFGIVTPTEAGAFGAAVSILLSILQGRMNTQVLIKSVVEALASTARVFWIALGAILFTRFLALTGAVGELQAVVELWGADPVVFILITAIVYLVLGMFLDPLGLLLLTLPLLLPLAEALDLNLIWFGVLVVKFIEIGLLTPPVGLNVYAVKSVVGSSIKLETIFRGVSWFLLCEVVVVVLLVAFPSISLALVQVMN